MSRIRVVLLVCLLVAGIPFDAPLAGEPGAPTALPYEAMWGALLDRHTEAVDAKVGTRVDYRGLEKDPAWPALVASLARVEPARLSDRSAKLAFWINAYNILTIDLVLHHYPISSIRDIGNFFLPVWDRDAGRIGGEEVTLGQIEHEILRPMGEPRIHAAIVCASISCPNLLREPYTAARLDSQLDASMRAWLARPEKGARLDPSTRTLWLSSIFDWFEEDFEREGGIVAFVARFVAPDTRKWLQANDERVKIRYFDYDWGLNE